MVRLTRFGGEHSNIVGLYMGMGCGVAVVRVRFLCAFLCYTRDAKEVCDPRIAGEVGLKST
eukprot:m.439825 g.439825  ORF g.439825 m.439825 type:complete len:61 (-) comp120800_c0_seq1:53-235(-)